MRGRGLGFTGRWRGGLGWGGRWRMVRNKVAWCEMASG